MPERIYPAPKPRKPIPTHSDVARAVMHRRGLTPHAVSAGSGVDQTVVNRWYTGQRDIKSSTFQRICDYLGLQLVEAPGPEGQ